MTTDKPCPTPNKVRYATLETAERRAHFRSVQSELNQEYTAYECACGWFHLSSSSANSFTCPSADTVEDMAELSYGSFQEVVLLDVKGRLPATMAGFLRHPRVLKRWRAELKVLASEIHADLKRIPSNTERHRGVAQLGILTEKRSREAYRILMELTDGHGAGIRGSESPAVLRDRKARKELRRTAGDKAIERLVGAHLEEFRQYFQEEADRIGLVLDRFPEDMPVAEIKDIGREDPT